VDFASDPLNCGRCSNKCGNRDCVSGTCAQCAKNESPCGGACCAANQVCLKGTFCEQCGRDQMACNGQCIDVQFDSQNCGKCGNVCGKGKVCMNGACGDCANGQMQCNGRCVALQTDISNCGACNTFRQKGRECVNGKCGCQNGQMVCNGFCTAVNFAPA